MVAAATSTPAGQRASQPYPATRRAQRLRRTGRIVALSLLAPVLVGYLRTAPSGTGGHWGAWCFLCAVGIFAWWLVAGVVVPDVARGVAAALRAATSRPARVRLGLLAVACLVVLPGWRTSQVDWTGIKQFDDTMAISNAYVLVDNDMDTDKMYFRSFLRVGFVAAALPLTQIQPARLAKRQRSRTDNLRRVWRIYTDRPAGQRVPPSRWGAFRVFGYAAAALMLLLGGVLFRLFQRSGLAPPLALLGAGLGTWFFQRSLDTPVTQTFTYFVGLVTALVCVRANRPGTDRWGRLAVAGAAVALAALTMNTLAVILGALAVQQIVALVATRRRRQAARFAAVYGFATVVVLIWYDLFLRGFVFESRLFMVEVRETDRLMHYAPLTWHAFLHTAGTIFGPVMWLLPMSLVAVIAKRLAAPGASLFVPWAVLSLAVLPSADFIFPRFLMYAIPPACWLLIAAATALLPRRRRDAWSAQPG